MAVFVGLAEAGVVSGGSRFLGRRENIVSEMARAATHPTTLRASGYETGD